MDQIVGSGRSGERSGALLVWKKILRAGTQSFPLSCRDHPHAVCTGMGKGNGHVFLLRCGSLNCVSVTAYIVSASCGPWILNSGSDSFALFLITQVKKES